MTTPTPKTIAPRAVNAKGRAKPSSTLKTVDKALNTLDFLTAFGGQVGVREMAEYLGINKSSTHRLLTTLERHGYVAQDPITGKYQLGIRMFEAGAVVFTQMELRTTARPHLLRLADVTGEVVHLAVVSGSLCVYVDKVEGPRAIPMASQVGWRKPLYCTGIGKVLLAYLPETLIEQILLEQDLKPLTPNSITDLDQLRAQLVEIRARGVAYDREEIEVGLCCVAAPVLRSNGQLVGAISLAGPAGRFEEEHLPTLAEQVRATAAAVSRDLEMALAGSRNVAEVPCQGSHVASREPNLTVLRE